jgi:NAD(P)H dehydrogenase (quinone)
MRAHFVIAHPEPRSFNGALAEAGANALGVAGWTVTTSDLYALGFDPAERPEHYSATGRFDAQAAQRAASEADALPRFVGEELQRLDAADLLVLQYPMWWHLPPAMLKGWFDRVFVYGAGYSSKTRFETGRFRGKRALVSVTAGTSRETYMFDGRSGDIDMLLWPVHFTLAFVGYTVARPFVSYGVEGGLRYSDDGPLRARLDATLQQFAAELPQAMTREALAFNRMAEWGADGRIAPGAPVHSPFVRRVRDLRIE